MKLSIGDLMERAERQAMKAREAILAGRVEAHPADPQIYRHVCAWCDYRDICRVETLPADREADAGR